jgi:hypothetical protein
MTDTVNISSDVLRQVLNAACSPYCAQILGQLIPEIRAALGMTLPVAIPYGVTYSASADNFYKNGYGQGNQFYLNWYERRYEFPKHEQPVHKQQPWPSEDQVWDALQAYLRCDSNAEGMRAALIAGAREPDKAVKLTNIHKAVIGRDHFGNPIPKEWYAAAEQLEAAVLKANGWTE